MDKAVGAGTSSLRAVMDIMVTVDTVNVNNTRAAITERVGTTPTETDMKAGASSLVIAPDQDRTTLVLRDDRPKAIPLPVTARVGATAPAALRELFTGVPHGPAGPGAGPHRTSAATSAPDLERRLDQLFRLVSELREEVKNKP